MRRIALALVKYILLGITGTMAVLLACVGIYTSLHYIFVLMGYVPNESASGMAAVVMFTGTLSGIWWVGCKRIDGKYE